TSRKFVVRPALGRDLGRRRDDQHDTKAKIDCAEVRAAVIAKSRAADHGPPVPCAATRHALAADTSGRIIPRTGLVVNGIEPFLIPLPGITVHGVQTPRILL